MLRRGRERGLDSLDGCFSFSSVQQKKFRWDRAGEWRERREGAREGRKLPEQTRNRPTLLRFPEGKKEGRKGNMEKEIRDR